MILSYEIPVTTRSESNYRPGGKTLRAKMVRTRAQREFSELMTRDAVRRFGGLLGPIVRIKLIRMSCGRPTDCDNLPPALKQVRDGIARGLGISDGPEAGIKWEYDQMRVKRERIGVLVEIET